MTWHGRFTRVLFLVIVLGAVASCASAGERVEELWRSDYGVIRASDPLSAQSTFSTPVDPSDGSVWLIAGANVLHLEADGQLVFRSEALHAPSRLAVDPAGGSCWVLEGLSDRILHFDGEGALVSATSFQRDEAYPGAMYYWLTPSPADGSVWVTGWHLVARIDATGEEVWRASYGVQRTPRVGAPVMYRVVVEPNDGSGWTFDGSDVVRLRADGGEMWRVAGAGGYSRVLAEDVRDKSVWTVLSGQVTHVSSEGAVLQHVTDGRAVRALSVSPADGSVWVEYYDFPPQTAPQPAAVESVGQEVVHLDSSGGELWRLADASLVALNEVDGSAWVAVGGELVRYSSEHEELSRLPMPEQLLALDPNDNSWWTEGERKLQHLAPDGTVLWEDRLAQLHQLWLSNDWVLGDGSCWVADRPALWSDADGFVHLSAAGEELERRALPDSSLRPRRLAISPFDGTWWIDALDGSLATVLLHLDEDGLELSRSGEVGWVRAIDGADGSLWAARNFPPSGGGGYLRRLAPDGTVAWTQALANGIHAIAVDPADGSAWVSTSGALRPKLLQFSKTGSQISEIVLPEPLPASGDLAVLPSDGSVYGVSRSGHGQGYAFRFAGDGRLMWLKGDLVGAGEIAVDPADGSAWVVDLGMHQSDFSQGSAVVHFAADGTELWRGTTFNLPQAIAVSPTDGTVWVSDWRNGQMVHLRAERLPFSDVAGDCWAWDAIRACYTAGIVGGYSDGCYRPESAVTRDQMAVYVSRAVAGGDASVPTGPVEPSFSDVGTDHWAYDHIEFALSQNIVEGYVEGDYRPEPELTRDQMAVYVARAMVAPTGEAALEDYMPADPRDFHDVPSTGYGDDGTEAFWAYKHIEYCVEHDVVKGYDDGLYHPEWVVTRDQMAVYVARAFGLVS